MCFCRRLTVQVGDIVFGLQGRTHARDPGHLPDEGGAQ